MGGDGTKMNSEFGGGGGGGAPNSVRSERKRKRPICLKMIAAVDIFQRKFSIQSLLKIKLLSFHQLTSGD